MATHPNSPPGRFPEFLEGLLATIPLHSHVVPGWLCVYIWNRLRRLGNRVARLMDQLSAGTYRAPRPRAPRPDAAPRPPRARTIFGLDPSTPADAKLPSGSGWLRRVLFHNGGQHSVQGSSGMLFMLLYDDRMMDYCTTCPTLGRHLRALCHMLGIKDYPAYLRLPRRKRKPRDPNAPPRPRAQPAPPPPPEPVPPPPMPTPWAVVTSFEYPHTSPSLTILGLKSWTPIR